VTFEEGTAGARDRRQYVRATVLFALVLFVVAVGQRFKVRGVQIAANAVVVGLLAYALFTVSTCRDRRLHSREPTGCRSPNRGRPVSGSKR
jgi:hypothetical protein